MKPLVKRLWLVVVATVPTLFLLTALAAGDEVAPTKGGRLDFALIESDEPEAGDGSDEEAASRPDPTPQTEPSLRVASLPFPDDVNLRRGTIQDAFDAPPIAEQDVAAKLLPKPRRYDLTVLLAGEYDSNVRLRPELSGLGPDEDKSDYRSLVASFLDYRLIATDDWLVGILGSSYDTFQFDATDFNLQDYMGGGYINRRFGPDWIGATRYEFHHTLLNERRLASDHRLNTSLSRLAAGGHTTAFYEFNPLDSRAIALRPAQDQSGVTHRVGVKQAIDLFDNSGRVYLVYRFSRTSADGSDFDRRGHQSGIRYEQSLWWNCFADADVRYAWEDYDNANSLDALGRARRDRRTEVRLGIQKSFAPRLTWWPSRSVSLRLDYTYIGNQSNTANASGLKFFDYDRHILSTQMLFSL